MLRKSLVTMIAVLGTATVFAGPQYVDKSGFAASGYDVVAFFDLEQTPVGVRQPPAVPGKKNITVEHNGATWAFSSEANKQRFVAAPEKFTPAYDGHCAYGAALGGKVPGNPNLWRIRDGRLFLNVTTTVVGFWEEDIPGFIEKANGNWGALEPKPASKKVVPQLKTSAAPLQ